MVKYIKDGAYTIAVEDDDDIHAAGTDENKGQEGVKSRTPVDQKSKTEEENKKEESDDEISINTDDDINYTSQSFILQNLKIAFPRHTDDPSHVLSGRSEIAEMISSQVCFYCYCILQAFQKREEPPLILIFGDGFIGTRVITKLTDHGGMPFIRIYSRGDYGAQEWKNRGYHADSSLSRLLNQQKPAIVILCADYSSFYIISHQLIDKHLVSPETCLITTTLGYQRKRLLNTFKIPTILRTFVEPLETLKSLKEEAEMAAMEQLDEQMYNSEFDADNPTDRMSPPPGSISIPPLTRPSTVNGTNNISALNLTGMNTDKKIDDESDEDDDSEHTDGDEDKQGKDKSTARSRSRSAAGNTNKDDNDDDNEIKFIDNNLEKSIPNTGRSHDTDSSNEDDMDVPPVDLQPSEISTENGEDTFNPIAHAATILANRVIDVKNLLYIMENFYAIHRMSFDQARKMALRSIYGYNEQAFNNSLQQFNSLQYEGSVASNNTSIDSILNNHELNHTAMNDKSVKLRTRSRDNRYRFALRAVEKFQLSLHTHVATLFQKEFSKLVSIQEFMYLVEEYRDHEEPLVQDHNGMKTYVSPDGKHHFVKAAKTYNTMHKDEYILELFLLDDDYSEYEGPGFEYMAKLDHRDLVKTKKITAENLESTTGSITGAGNEKEKVYEDYVLSEDQQVKQFQRVLQTNISLANHPNQKLKDHREKQQRDNTNDFMDNSAAEQGLQFIKSMFSHK